jgi:hypothetical protein
MSTDQPEKLSRSGGDRRRRRHTGIDVVAARKRKAKSRKAAKAAKLSRKKQRR